jgi:hypothetical protein
MEQTYKMTTREKQLLKEHCKGKEANDLIRSETYIDTGRWWRKSPLWLCFFKDECVVMALGRRRYIESVSCKEYADSHYCHTTGELVIAPRVNLTHKRFKLSPANALRALHALGIDITIISNHSAGE